MPVSLVLIAVALPFAVTPGASPTLATAHASRLASHCPRHGGSRLQEFVGCGHDRQLGWICESVRTFFTDSRRAFGAQRASGCGAPRCGWRWRAVLAHPEPGRTGILDT